MSDPNPPGTTGTNVTVALSGLLTGMFVAAISSTVVVTSLPVIVPELGGGQASYTWIATATLLAMTVATPVWGKLADLFDRRRLFEIGIALLVVASVIAGFADSLNLLIAMRVVQGIGAGGLAALSQIILADIISPRERGRYAGRIGAALTSANILGPLIGGLITDTVGWRWNFYLVLPVAVGALILVRRSLHLPVRPSKAITIDYAGATLISAGIGLFLIWLTAGGAEFDRTSTTGWLLLAAAGGCVGWAVRVELRAPHPLIPPAIFRDPTVSLAVLASLGTGAVMFSALVYLPQYFQFARGVSAVMSGLMTTPVMLGLMASTTIVGRLITKSGNWKPYLIGGGVLLVVGVGWLAQLRADTPYTTIAGGMILLGAGVGALLQNLVVITQNAVAPANIGAATAAVTFFRSLGGAVGIAVLGAVIQTGVAERIRHDAATQPSAQRLALDAQLDRGGILDPAQLPDPLRQIAAGAYGMGVGALFLLLAAAAFVVLAAVVALPPAALSRATAVQASAGQPAAGGQRGAGGRRWHGDTFLWTGDTILLPVYAPTPAEPHDVRPSWGTAGPAGPGRRPVPHAGHGAGGRHDTGDGWQHATRRQAAPSWAAETAEWPLVQLADPHIDPRGRQRADPRNGYRTDPRADPRGGYRTDPGDDPRGGYRTDPGDDPRGGYRTDPGDDPRGGYRTDSHVDPRGGQRADPRADHRHRVGHQAPQPVAHPSGRQDARRGEPAGAAPTVAVPRVFRARARVE